MIEHRHPTLIDHTSTYQDNVCAGEGLAQLNGDVAPVAPDTTDDHLTATFFSSRTASEVAVSRGAARGSALATGIAADGGVQHASIPSIPTFPIARSMEHHCRLPARSAGRPGRAAPTLVRRSRRERTGPAPKARAPDRWPGRLRTSGWALRRRGAIVDHLSAEAILHLELSS